MRLTDEVVESPDKDRLCPPDPPSGRIASGRKSPLPLLLDFWCFPTDSGLSTEVDVLDEESSVDLACFTRMEKTKTATTCALVRKLLCQRNKYHVSGENSLS